MVRIPVRLIPMSIVVACGAAPCRLTTAVAGSEVVKPARANIEINRFVIGLAVLRGC